MSSFHRILHIATVVGASILVLDLAVIFINNKCVSGPQICAQDLEAAKVIGADKPGAYMFDCKTGLPVMLPSSKALAMIFKGISDPSYSGQTKCGFKALTHHVDGLILVIFILGTIITLLIKLIMRIFK